MSIQYNYKKCPKGIQEVYSMKIFGLISMAVTWIAGVIIFFLGIFYFGYNWLITGLICIGALLLCGLVPGVMAFFDYRIEQKKNEEKYGAEYKIDANLNVVKDTHFLDDLLCALFYAALGIVVTPYVFIKLLRDEY